jgi:hypothetical protein
LDIIFCCNCKFSRWWIPNTADHATSAKHPTSRLSCLRCQRSLMGYDLHPEASDWWRCSRGVVSGGRWLIFYLSHLIFSDSVIDTNNVIHHMEI